MATDLSLKLLIILNDVSAFKDRMVYLQTQAIELRTASSLGSGLAMADVFRPDVIFISWDLKYTNVRKAYELLIKHGFLCIVFSEDKSPLRVTGLLNSGIPNVVLPPVSGNSIAERTRKLVRERDEFLRKFARIRPEELPTDGNWEKRVQGRDGQPSVYQMDNYFMKSTSQPIYDPRIQAWRLDTDAEIYKRAGPNLPADGVSELLASANIVQVAARLSGNVGPGNLAQIEADSKSASAFIEKSMEVAVEYAVKRTETETNPITTVTNGTVTLVRTPVSKGYVVGANAGNTVDRDLAGKVGENLAKALKGFGQTGESDVTVHPVDLEGVAFQLWAEQNAQFMVNSQHGKDDIAFAYFLSKTIIERPDGKTELFALDLEEALIADREIDFEIYIHLPKNRKFVQYINRPTVFAAATKAKLLGRGIKEVFVRNEQFGLFEIYCVKNEISTSIAKFKFKQLAQKK
jgi:hypothetical protein